MGSGGQQPVTQQTLQTKDPWSVAQPELQQVLTSAQDHYQRNVGYQPYTGNTTAPLQNQYMTPGMTNVAAIANAEPGGSANVNAARGYLGDLIGNQGLTAPLQDIASTMAQQQNPYLQGVL